jgi:chlorobactene glucosyltransferase
MLFLHILCTLISLGWLYALFRSLRAMRRKRYELDSESPKASVGPLISIVIPARNEERNIEACVLSAIEQDYEKIEVIVLDDASHDQTPVLLEALLEKYTNLTVLKGDGSPLPAGWFGKPWALERAQKKAKGSWLVFVDADVVLTPQVISRCLFYARHHDLEMVTGLGNLVMKSFWEKVLQPAIGGLILAGNSLSKVNDHSQKDHNLANGQFIMISRTAYEDIGRHGAVRKDILDDIGIARALAHHDQPYHCLHLQDLFSCRMYTSFAEIWEGWTKNLFAGVRYSWKNLILTILFTYGFSSLGITLLFLASLGCTEGTVWWSWGIILTLLPLSMRLLMDVRRKQNPLYGLTHPFANLIVCALLLNSALRSTRGTVRWKGRIYKPEETQSEPLNKNSSD